MGTISDNFNKGKGKAQQVLNRDKVFLMLHSKINSHVGAALHIRQQAV